MLTIPVHVWVLHSSTGHGMDFYLLRSPTGEKCSDVDGWKANNFIPILFVTSTGKPDHKCETRKRTGKKKCCDSLKLVTITQKKRFHRKVVSLPGSESTHQCRHQSVQCLYTHVLNASSLETARRTIIVANWQFTESSISKVARYRSRLPLRGKMDRKKSLHVVLSFLLQVSMDVQDFLSQSHTQECANSFVE